MELKLKNHTKKWTEIMDSLLSELIDGHKETNKEDLEQFKKLIQTNIGHFASQFFHTRSTMAHIIRRLNKALELETLYKYGSGFIDNYNLISKAVKYSNWFDKSAFKIKTKLN